MWGKHDINKLKVWLRRLSLHEIVRLRDIARTDYQLRAIRSFNDQSDQILPISTFSHSSKTLRLKPGA